MPLHSAHVLTARVMTATPITLSVISGTVRLDDSWTPYAQAEIVVYTPDQALIDSLDPRIALRVELVTTQTYLEDAIDRAAVTRTFNLGLRERSIDAESGTMSLYLESDEALLRDWALVSATTERTYGVSVKDATTYALGKIGATLQAGAADANIASKATEPVLTNYLPNPSLEVNTTGWASGTGRCTISRITTEQYVGAACLQVLTNTAGGPSAATALSPATVGTQYTYTVYVKGSTSRAAHLELRFQNASVVGIGSDIVGTSATILTTGWTRLSVTGTAPAGTVTALMIFQTDTSAAVGERFYLDAGMLTLGSSAVPYFDGANINGPGGTRNAGLYAAAYTSGINSPSTLTNLPNSDATIWEPGISAADYIYPLVNAGGLRLYCDEGRRWYLVSSQNIDAQINISSETGVTAGQDVISRNDDSPWYDSVVVRYQWTDSANLQQVAYDVAGTGGGRTLLEVVDRIYLGAGAAAAILARAQGKGRTFNVSAQSNYTATPGMAVSIALPDTTLQTGTLSSVSWAFPDSTMSIGSRGLTDTPARAWILAPTGRTWSTPATGVTWSTYA